MSDVLLIPETASKYLPSLVSFYKVPGFFLMALINLSSLIAFRPSSTHSSIWLKVKLMYLFCLLLSILSVTPAKSSQQNLCHNSNAGLSRNFLY